MAAPGMIGSHIGCITWQVYNKKVDKSLCLPKLKSITVLLYDFSTVNEHF